MLTTFDKPPIRVDGQPSLGPVLLQVSAPTRPIAPRTVLAAPPAPATLDDVLIALKQIHTDLVILRTLQQSRTWSARWQRLCAWVRVRWQLLRER